MEKKVHIIYKQNDGTQEDRILVASGDIADPIPELLSGLENLDLDKIRSEWLIDPDLLTLSRYLKSGFCLKGLMRNDDTNAAVLKALGLEKVNGNLKLILYGNISTNVSNYFVLIQDTKSGLYMVKDKTSNAVIFTTLGNESEFVWQITWL
ncbi:hypothetical protein J1780_03530 [Rahnella aceris]|uniref:hypothetical protein n=1 Tax=Rahnella sp. (strain Y9602) TaxID=2703885 RepID=UPI001C26236A|nr:hypothetical protein [Rahnella aceris]MBU9839030.1 hypothetical protein [Rahnella aceris]